MNKFVSTVSSVCAIGLLAATGYMFLNKKKNMLDVIIEEIETMK